MRFGKEFLKMLHPETARLLSRADRMTDAGTDKIARTNAWIKAIDRAYANEEWSAYLGALFYGMWSMECCDAIYMKRLLQYSNDFLRFDEEWRRELVAGAGNFKGWAGRTYVNMFTYIYEFYADYHQISDEKIQALLVRHEQVLRGCPSASTEFQYQFIKMEYGMLTGDKKTTADSLRRVMALQRETNLCYVCKNREISAALLMLGRTDEALHRIRQIVSDEGLPEWWYEDYSNCENASACEQYGALIGRTFWLRMPEMFCRLAQEFRSEILDAGEDQIGWDVDLLVLTALGETDTRQEAYLKEMVEVLETFRELTPKQQLLFWLSGWGYLEMLGRNGVETVALNLQKPLMAEQDGVYDTLALAAHFLRKADELGTKFDHSRPTFRYESLRHTVQVILASGAATVALCE